MRNRLTLVLIAALSLSACGHKDHDAVATVDTLRLRANWPKFQNYQNQLYADFAAIEQSRDSAQSKARRRAELAAKYARIQDEIVGEVRDAAAQVARRDNYALVVTREHTGYGGPDITPEVEKLLKIVETSPSP